MDDVTVTKEVMYKIMGGFEGMTAVGPDGISGSVLEDCRDLPVGPAHDIIQPWLAQRP